MAQLLHDRYRIQQKLGQGGMGEVYLAEDTTLPGRFVALKENTLRDRKTQAQFQREALLLARLHHPNLPQVSDYFRTDDGRQFLVMDYVRGENLQQRLRSAGGPMAEADVLTCARQILEALHYLHTWRDPDSGVPRPVIHRDIKPANIKQMPDGRYVLLDFGISKANMDEATALSARALTPGYSPMEQYDGGTDARSDIYSLGATLYALVTANAPPSATGLASGTPLIPVRDFNRQVSRRLTSIIERAMALRAENRYRSAAEMYLALYDEALPEAQPAAAAATPPAADARRATTHRSLRRNRRFAVPALLLTVALLWIVAGTAWLLFSEQAPAGSTGDGDFAAQTGAGVADGGTPVAMASDPEIDTTPSATPSSTATETPDLIATENADETRVAAILATRDAQATADAPTATQTPTALPSSTNTATPSQTPTLDLVATAQLIAMQTVAFRATQDVEATRNAATHTPTSTSTPMPTVTWTATTRPTETSTANQTSVPAAKPTVAPRSLSALPVANPAIPEDGVTTKAESFDFSWHGDASRLPANYCYEVVFWAEGEPPDSAYGIMDARATCRVNSVRLPVALLPRGVTYQWAVLIVRFADKDAGTGYERVTRPGESVSRQFIYHGQGNNPNRSYIDPWD